MERERPPQHLARRLRPGAPALLAAAVGAPALAGAPRRRRPRAHELLHAQLAVLAVARVDVHRPVPRAARRGRQRDLARARRARPRDPDRRLDPARRGLPSELHRQVAPLAGGLARHDGVRLRRLGRQRPPLHGLGRHRRALRSRSSRRTRRRGCAPTRRRRPSRGSSPSRSSTRTT